MVNKRREKREEVFTLNDRTHKEKVNELAVDIQCGPRLAEELLTLAGGDFNLVRDASTMCRGINAVKAYIIDRRFKKVE